MEQKRYYKIAVMGSGGVGKSCLTLRVKFNVFKDIYDPTLEDSYRVDRFLVDGEDCGMEIFDTAGQVTDFFCY